MEGGRRAGHASDGDIHKQPVGKTQALMAVAEDGRARNANGGDEFGGVGR
jgi:hypothetical protein